MKLLFPLLCLTLCIYAAPSSLQGRADVENTTALVYGRPLNGTVQRCQYKPGATSAILNESSSAISSTSRVGELQDPNKESCFSMTVTWKRQNQFEKEALWKTLISALDWTAHVWYNGQEQWDGKFHPNNFYGIQISAQRISVGNFGRDCATWMVDTIGFWMRDENAFVEMSAEIYKDEKLYAKLTVQSAPPANGPASSGDSTIGSGSSATNLTSSRAAERAGLLPVTLSDPGATNMTGSDGFNGTMLNGTSPHTFNKKLKTKITEKDRMIGPDVENDLMTSLLCVARQAAFELRKDKYACSLPPDRTVTQTVLVPGRTVSSGKDVLEALADIAEYEYFVRRTKGSFFDLEVRAGEVRSRGGWTELALIEVVWT